MGPVVGQMRPEAERGPTEGRPEPPPELAGAGGAASWVGLGMRSSWPICRLSGSLRLLAAAMALTETPYWSAMSLRVSALRTVWMTALRVGSAGWSLFGGP